MLVKLHRPPPEIRIFLPNLSARSRTATRRPRFPASIAHINPAAPPPRISASNEWVTSRSHVKQAEPGKAVVPEQSLVDVLLLKLLDVRRRHFPAVGSEIAVRLRTNCDQFLVRSSRQQHGKDFFLQNRQPAFQILQPGWPLRAGLSRQLAQCLGCLAKQWLGRNPVC